LADDCSETILTISFLSRSSHSWHIGGAEEVFHNCLLPVLVSFDTFNVLFYLEFRKHFRCIVIEELVYRRELACDSFDALLCNEASKESAHWIEDTLALE